MDVPVEAIITAVVSLVATIVSLAGLMHKQHKETKKEYQELRDKYEATREDITSYAKLEGELSGKLEGAIANLEMAKDTRAKTLARIDKLQSSVDDLSEVVKSKEIIK